MAKHEAKKKKEARRKRRSWTPFAIVGIVMVVAVIGWFSYHAAADLPGTRLPDLGNLHIPTAESPHEPYNSDPPTSGPHLTYIAPWGVYTRPIPRELQVHNLEDAGVLVQYGCGCPDLVAKLRDIVQRYDKQVILAPYPQMKTRIVLTAWTRLDAFDEFDARRITRFIEAYRGIDHHK